MLSSLLSIAEKVVDNIKSMHTLKAPGLNGRLRLSTSRELIMCNKIK